VGVCGELAGDWLAAPLLVSMGLTELSMGASSIPRVKEAVRNCSAESSLWGAVRRRESAKEVRALLEGTAKLTCGRT